MATKIRKIVNEKIEAPDGAVRSDSSKKPANPDSYAPASKKLGSINFNSVKGGTFRPPTKETLESFAAGIMNGSIPPEKLAEYFSDDASKLIS